MTERPSFRHLVAGNLNLNPDPASNPTSNPHAYSDPNPNPNPNLNVGNRSVMLLDAYFEWQGQRGGKLPYYIHAIDSEPSKASVTITLTYRFTQNDWIEIVYIQGTNFDVKKKELLLTAWKKNLSSHRTDNMGNTMIRIVFDPKADKDE